MKVAIATEGEHVSAHFGRCEYFTVVQLEGDQVCDKKLVGAAGNQHSALPGYLATLGVDVVISGGMGTGAHEKLTQRGIDIFTGVQGTVDETIEKFIKGELEPAAANCHAHGHSQEAHGGKGTGHSCNCGGH